VFSLVVNFDLLVKFSGGLGLGGCWGVLNSQVGMAKVKGGCAGLLAGFRRPPYFFGSSPVRTVPTDRDVRPFVARPKPRPQWFPRLPGLTTGCRVADVPVIVVVDCFEGSVGGSGDQRTSAARLVSTALKTWVAPALSSGSLPFPHFGD
jgi:hypothetical protein